MFLSSHILSDVERTCDHVVILREGGVALSESMSVLRSRSDEWEIEVLTWTPAALEAVAGADIRDEKNGTVSIRCRSEDKNTLLRRLLDATPNVGAVRRARSLEDLYIQHAEETRWIAAHHHSERLQETLRRRVF